MVGDWGMYGACKDHHREVWRGEEGFADVASEIAGAGYGDDLTIAGRVGH